MNKRTIIICLLLLVISTVIEAQNPVARVLDRLSTFQFFNNSPVFTYTLTDTAYGYEILLYEKSYNTCNRMLFFLETTDTPTVKENLFQWLTRVGVKYHFIYLDVYSFLFNCGTDNIDTCFYCNETKRDEQLNFGVSLFNPNSFYDDFQGHNFSVNKIKVVVDRYLSDDIKYAKYYYHFLDNLSGIKKVEKIHYRRVLSRESMTNKQLLNSKKKRFNDFDCIITRD